MLRKIIDIINKWRGKKRDPEKVAAELIVREYGETLRLLAKE